MQTNCELSKNNRYSRGYLYSNKEIKTIYLVNEFKLKCGLNCNLQQLKLENDMFIVI